MAPESITKLLEENAELRPLTERLRLIQRLQKRYRTLAPELLAQASRVCAIDGTTVVICASSGPVAAALRHIAPRLLEGLKTIRTSKHSRDQELTSIRLEVQVEAPAPRRKVVGRSEPQWDRMAQVASHMSDSPLKGKLEQIAKEHAAKRARSKN